MCVCVWGGGGGGVEIENRAKNNNLLRPKQGYICGG